MERTSADPVGMAPQLRGSSLIFVANLAGAFVELGTQVIAARYLSKAEFGALAFALSIVLFCQNIALFGMPLTVARFVPMRRESGDLAGLRGILATCVGIVVGLGAVCVTALVVAVTLLPSTAVDPTSARLVAVLALLIPLEALQATLTSVFASYGQTRAIVIRGSLLAPGLKFAVTSTLIVFGTSLEFVAVGYVGASLVGAILYAWMCRRLLRSEGVLAPRRRLPVCWPWRELLPFAAVALATTMVWAMIEMSDAILLGVLRGPEDVAALRAVTPFTRANAIIVASFVILFTPLAARYFARRDGRASQQLYVRTSAWLAALSFPVFLTCSVFSGELVRTMLGPAYASSATVLLVLSVGYFAQTVTGFNGQVLKVHGHLRRSLVIDGFAVTLNVGLNVLLIPAWGALGAAVGTAGTLLVHNVLKQVSLHRLTGISLRDAPYLRLLGTALLLTGVAAGFQAVVRPGLPVALLLTAAASLLLVRANREALRVEEFFPGLARMPLLRHVVGTRRVAPRPQVAA
jgi:O-antigen/teichoic acid export membrane protein